MVLDDLRETLAENGVEEESIDLWISGDIYNYRFLLWDRMFRKTRLMRKIDGNNRTMERLMTKKLNYFQQIIASSKLIEEVLSKEDKPNPYKGECYIASALLYEMYDGDYMHFCRKLDCYDQYHWWIYYNDGVNKRHIDMTNKQYYIENVDCPSDDMHGIGIANKLPYSSYKKRIQRLKDKVEQYEASQDHG